MLSQKFAQISKNPPEGDFWEFVGSLLGDYADELSKRQVAVVGADLAGVELDVARSRGKKGVIAALLDVLGRVHLSAALAHYDVASLDGLAAIALHP